MVFIAGLNFAGLPPVKAFLKEYRIKYAPKKFGYAASLILGMAFAAGWTPCVGPILSGVLVLAASSSDPAFGVFLLSLYSMGFALPFAAVALAMEQGKQLLKIPRAF
ncbi:MAG TPA: hypothetical protein DEA47_00915 [Peptococcaceae bacterium]|nr:MAG: Cytochrome c biogenesis protein, transmembrane region [Clostridia bacterium 41_269]HBT19925.1 hypothetical protein [Peptococcaceae bacterium]